MPQLNPQDRRFIGMLANTLANDMPARRVPDEHRHQCPRAACRTVWSHRTSDMNSHAEHVNGHKCPNCGTEQYWKFFG